MSVAAFMLAGALPASVAEPGPAPALPPMDEALATRLATSGDAVLEAIVMMESAATNDDLLRAREHGLGVTPPLHSFPEVFAVRGPASAVRAFLLDGGVAWAEWNAPLELHLDTARLATRSQSVAGNVPGMGGPLTIDGQVIDGTGVGVAVVDGGIDASHPDLQWGSKVKKNMNFICTTPGLISTATRYCFGNWELMGEPTQPDGFCDETLLVDAPTSDHTSGHGTHVAGIVGGTGSASGGLFQGVAPGATLYGFGAGEGISILFSVEAFDWVLCNMNKVDPPIRVVNNSWGTPPSTTGCSPPAGYDQPTVGVTRLLVDTMVARGINVVFSSGNSGGTGSVACNSPQSRIPTPGVIGVASFNDEDRGTTDGALSGFSSRGISSLARKDTWPDISAPGDLITSTQSRTGHVANTPAFATPEVRNPNYTIISGTSMAAPHLAGIAALVRQANPALTPAQVEDLLEDTAHKFTAGGAYSTDPFNPGGDPSSFDKGHGLANARAAVLAAAALAGSTPGDTPAVSGDLAGQRLYLRTAPTGLGNVDRDYFAWESSAPTKEAPSLWSDAANMLQNSDTFGIPALYPQGGVSLVNQDVKVRFWASALGGADLASPTAPPSWTVRLQVGSFSALQSTSEALPVTGGPKQYEVTFPAVTASGTTMKVRFDSASGLNTGTPGASREVNFGNAIWYDATNFPTSIAFGTDPANGIALPTGAAQVCIRERPGTCYGTIQAAVSAANAGEHLDASPGNYNEAVVIGKAVSVEAQGGSAVTAIRTSGADPVRITAAGAGLRGFTVSNSGAGASSSLVRVEAASAGVADNVLLASAGRGVLTTGAGGASLSGNTIGAPTSVEVAGAGATSVVDNAIGRGGGTGVLVQAGAGATSVSGNDFRASAVHVRDLAGQLSIGTLLAQNTFDRAVFVSTGGALLNAIFGAVQGGVNAASAGSAVIARTATYAESVSIPAGKDGLTLCTASAGAACNDGGATLDATGIAPVALTVRSNGVTVRGWDAIRAASDPGVAVDARGTTGFTLRGGSLEAGAAALPGETFGGMLPSSFAQGPLQDYFRDAFVDATLQDPGFAAVRAAHAGEPGLLSIVPVAGSDAHVGLIYSGASPQAVKDSLAANGGTEQGLPVKVHEHTHAQVLRERVSDEDLAGITTLSPEEAQAGPQGPLLPGPGSGIGPGSHLIITIPSNTGIGGSDTGGTFRCSANFVFKDAAGNYYLGTAGHCVLQEDAPDSFSPRFRQPTSFQVCLANCIGSTVRTGTYVQLGAGGVLFAQQTRNGNGFGQDYSWYKIPASQVANIRPFEPFWGGPTGSSGLGFTQPVVHYGHGVGIGEVFATEGRAGLGFGGIFIGDEGSYDAIGWATGGDSGSGSLTGQPRVGQKLVGREALGDITHSIVVVGAPVFIGTTVEQALGFLQERAGVDLDLVMEDGGIVPPEPPLLAGIDLRGSTGATVEDAVILGAPGQQDGGVGVMAAGAQGARIARSEVRLWSSSGIALTGGASGATVQDNTIADGCDGVVLGDASGNLLTGNAFSSLACEAVLLTSPQGGSVAGNVLRLNVFRGSVPIVVDANVASTTLDARANDLGVHEWQLVEQAAVDLGDGNTVQLVPFLLADGTLEPGLVRVAGGSCAGRAATAPENACGFLSIGEAMAYALDGSTVAVPASSDADNPTPRLETATIARNGLTLCAARAGGSTCSPSPATAIIDGSDAGAAVVVQGSGATVKGFTLAALSEAVRAVDARGTTGLTLRDNVIEARNAHDPGAVPGLAGAMAGDAAARDYLRDPYVAATLASPAYRDLVASARGLPGFLAAAPILQPAPHVGLLFEGAAPGQLPSAAGLSVQAYSHVKPQTLLEPVSRELYDQVTHQGAPQGPILPSPTEGIGPGTHILIARPDGTFRCSANFVFSGSDGKDYLGTAGHCVLYGGFAESTAPGYDAAAVRVSACVSGCLGATIPFGDFRDLGAVKYARQNELGEQFGNDFAWVEIPADLKPMVRPYMWFWGGPTGVHRSPTIDDDDVGVPLVHYGNGIGVGEEFPTKSRAGVSLGIFTIEGSYWSLGWVTGGDSGSGSNTGAARTSRLLLGDLANGDITHSIVGVGAPIFIGTTVERGMAFFLAETGVQLTLRLEDQPLVAPPPVFSWAVDIGGSTGARVEGNTITVEGGGCTADRSRCYDPQASGVQANAGAANVAILGNGVQGSLVSLQDETIGSTNGITGAFTAGLIEGNTVSGFRGNAIALFNGGGTTVRGNTLSVNSAGVLVCNSSGNTVWGNDITVSFDAIALCDLSDDNVLNWNRLGRTNGNGLQVRAGTPGTPTALAVDARFNCWDAQTLSGVRARIDDQGAGNAIDVVPFLDIDCLTPILPPTASFTHAPEPTTRIEDTVFEDTSDPGGRAITARTWDFGDGGTGTGSPASHRYASLGTFVATLTVTNGAELSSSATGTVTVINIDPTAAFSFAPSPSNRVDPTLFTGGSADPDGTISSSLWDFGDGVTSTEASPRHTYATLGTFTVTLTVTDNDGGTGTTTATVEVVNLVPTPDFVVDPEVPMILQPTSFDDASGDRDGTIDSWFWEFDDGFTSTDQDVLHIFTSGGAHDVSLTVEDNDGASATVARVVFVCDPVADLAATVDPEHLHVELSACIRLNESLLPVG